MTRVTYDSATAVLQIISPNGKVTVQRGVRPTRAIAVARTINLKNKRGAR